MNENEVLEITAWVCDECGYWRQEKSTGRHQQANWLDPRGRTLVHEVQPVRFVRADAVFRCAHGHEWSPVGDEPHRACPVCGTSSFTFSTPPETPVGVGGDLTGSVLSPSDEAA